MNKGTEIWIAPTIIRGKKRSPEYKSKKKFVTYLSSLNQDWKLRVKRKWERGCVAVRVGDNITLERETRERERERGVFCFVLDNQRNWACVAASLPDKNTGECQVKGWTVVEPARKYLNAKKRTCMQDKCTFVGNYKELRKHVKAKHPLARPRAVDPVLEEKWKRLECESERSDVISTIISSTPGAVVLGDYVLEPNQSGFYSDYESDLDDYFEDFGLRSLNLGRNAAFLPRDSYRRDFGSAEEDDFGVRRTTYPGYVSASGRGFHRARILVSRRRRRRRGNDNH